MNSIIYQFLNEPRRIRRQLEEVDGKIEDLRSTMLPGAIRYDKDNVMITPEDRMIDYAVRLEPLAKRWDVLIREYQVACTEFDSAMSLLTDKQAMVLRLKYLDGASNNQISKELGIDKRNVLRICDRAYETLLENILTATTRIRYNVI